VPHFQNNLQGAENNKLFKQLPHTIHYAWFAVNSKA